MRATLSKLSLGAVVFATTTTSALAQGYGGSWWSRIFDRFGGHHGHGGSGGSGGSGGGSAVPEIDVSTGLLAVAAVTAGLFLAYELRRRRQNG